MLSRFRKAKDDEPFSVDRFASANSVRPAAPAVVQRPTEVPASRSVAASRGSESQAGVAPTGAGLGQTTYEPPEWAVEPHPGVWWLEVRKEGVQAEIDRVPLERKCTVFGRLAPACHAVLEHPSISRQHAALVLHKNGSFFVIDLGSAHGTFVSKERIKPKQPEQLDVGCSLRFAASSRYYVLRKAASVQAPPKLACLQPSPELPDPPDPTDEDAVASYNTLLNRFGMHSIVDASTSRKGTSGANSAPPEEGSDTRPQKRLRRAKVSFKDEHGEPLALVVGVSDGADVDRDGPLNVQEGRALIGKYASSVISTIEPAKPRQVNASPGVRTESPGVSAKLKEFLTKSLSKDKDLYGDLPAPAQGSSWARAGPETSKQQGADSADACHGVDEFDADDPFGVRERTGAGIAGGIGLSS